MEIKSRQTIVLISSIFIFTLGFGIVIPLLPYYAKSAGADAFMLGMLLATFSFLQFFCGPFWGRISDHIGRKPVIVIGLLGFTLAFIILGLTYQMTWVFAAVVIGGALSAGIQPAAMAFIADISSPKERGGLMGVMGAASGVGLISGPFFSSVLASFGLSVPFFVAAAISFITMLCVNIMIQEPARHDKRLEIEDLILPVYIVRMVRDTFKQMFSALKTSVGIFLVATLVISFAIAGFEGTFTYYIIDMFNLTDKPSMVNVFHAQINVTGPMVTGAVFMMWGIVMVICQGFVVGKLINRFGEEHVIVWGLLIAAVGLVLMVVTQGDIRDMGHRHWSDLGVLATCICVISVGSGLIFPSLNTIISRRTDEKNQGVVMGIMTSYGNFGRILGPPIAGYTYVVNIAMPYFLSAVIMALTSVYIFLLTWGSQKKDNKEQTPEIVLQK